MSLSRWQARLGPLLTPASWLYGVIVSRRMQRYERDPGLSRSLIRPVLSVGNLSVGGSGKTPMVRRLATDLKTSGHTVSILSRGYGRDQTHVPRIVSDGRELVSRLTVSGDEPYELAKALPGVAIAVANQRYDAGRLVLESLPRFKDSVFILDDGFQHRQLARDLDLVCLDPHASVREMELLPRGRFREPLSALARADALIWTYWNRAAADSEVVATVEGWVDERKQRGQPIPEIFRAAYISKGVAPVGLSERGDASPDVQSLVDLESLREDPVALVAGIAQPERLVRDLEAQGFDIRHQCLREDHHWWSDRELQRELALATRKGVRYVLTTGKDASKLAHLARPELPIGQIEQSVEFSDESRWSDWLEARVRNLRLRS